MGGIGLEFGRAQQLLQIFGTHCERLEFIPGYTGGRPAADSRYLTFKNAHSGFPGIKGHDASNPVVGHLKLCALKAMLFTLLGNKVLFGYSELFLVGIAR